jgi:TolB-like protein
MQLFFGDQMLDTERRELCRGPDQIPMEPQVFDLLVYLVQHHERVVSRDDLISAIWNGRIVSDSTLTSRINAARKAIGDSGRDQKFIRTISRKGFRFIGALRSQPLGAPAVYQNSSSPHDRSEESHSPLLPLDKPAIAVLPFTNMSGEAEQEYFAEGISEDIITALSKMRWFYVIARNSSFIYRGKEVHLKQIGEELGVGYLVEGSVRKEGDRVRITVQLSNASSGVHIWSERYDRSLADVFDVQDEITGAIAAAIEPQLYAAENFRAQRKAPESMDAWDLVMRALSHYWRWSRQDNTVAQALLEKATALDPDYGQALSLLAASHMLSVDMGWQELATAIPVAEPSALAAIRADSEDPWAHFALAEVYLFTRCYDDSLAEFETTIRLNPSFSLARAYHCLALSFCGEWERGYMSVRHGLRLSPRGPFAAFYFSSASFSQFVGSNYEEAIRLSREALRQFPDMSGVLRVLTASAGMAGKDDIAKAALEDLCRLQPHISLEWVSATRPFKHKVDRDHYLEGLRRAGLK